MAEATSNVEIAHLVHERGEHHEPPSDKRLAWAGIAEAIVLSIVAVATAWSGYQAARWEGVSAQQYFLASRMNVQSESKAAFAGQQHLDDIATLNGWVAAEVAGHAQIAAIYERRFRPEYRVAFRDWLATHPLTNPKAPPGPSYMPHYHDTALEMSDKLEEESSNAFEHAIESRETADSYVKATVFLATVLFLTALSQRFEVLAGRVAIVSVAFVMLIASLYQIVVLPRN